MPAAALVLSDQDRRRLESWTRSSTISAGQRERAEIVLAVVAGAGVSGAARSLGVSRPTVIKWRDRFAADGVDGLDDLPRSGRPKTIDDAQIIAATLEPPPASLAVTHWSSRLLGKHLGIGDATVARAWRAYRVQPWRQGTFKFSTDPELEAKVRDVVGLYLDPPQNAIVLCVDEKSQIQALNRTQPILPVRPGLPEKATHDYKRNGTTTLFAALEVATGTITDRCYDRHGKAEFLDFLKLVAKTHPRRRLHVVLDNYHTHKHNDINRWLAKHPRITLHFTPTSGSWLNLVEVFFGIITTQAIRRGSFDNVKQLVATIRAFIDGYNNRCRPFIWTKAADDILTRATRQPTSDARHVVLPRSTAPSGSYPREPASRKSSSSECPTSTSTGRPVSKQPSIDRSPGSARASSRSRRSSRSSVSSTVSSARADADTPPNASFGCTVMTRARAPWPRVPGPRRVRAELGGAVVGDAEGGELLGGASSAKPWGATATDATAPLSSRSATLPGGVRRTGPRVADRRTTTPTCSSSLSFWSARAGETAPTTRGSATVTPSIPRANSDRAASACARILRRPWNGTPIARAMGQEQTAHHARTPHC